MKRLARLMLLLAIGSCDTAPGQAGFQGYVDAEFLRMAAPEGGWVTGLPVAKGQRIAEGTLLFTLDETLQRAAVAQARATLAQAQASLADLLKGARPEEIAAIQAQLAAADASLELARLQRARQEQLARTQVASEQALDQARAAADQAVAQRDRIRADLATARLPAREDRIASARASVEAAQAALEQAEFHLAQRRIAAPVGALVDDVVRRPGEWVPASGTVVSLLPPEATKVVFYVPEARRNALRLGDTVQVECSGCPQGLTARISRVAQEAEFTPPVIYSRETRQKLVWRTEAILAAIPGAPTPGQPVTVRSQP